MAGRVARLVTVDVVATGIVPRRLSGLCVVRVEEGRQGFAGAMAGTAEATPLVGCSSRNRCLKRRADDGIVVVGRRVCRGWSSGQVQPTFPSVNRGCRAAGPA